MEIIGIHILPFTKLLYYSVLYIILREFLFSTVHTSHALILLTDPSALQLCIMLVIIILSLNTIFKMSIKPLRTDKKQIAFRYFPIDFVRCAPKHEELPTILFIYHIPTTVMFIIYLHWTVISRKKKNVFFIDLLPMPFLPIPCVQIK